MSTCTVRLSSGLSIQAGGGAAESETAKSAAAACQCDGGAEQPEEHHGYQQRQLGWGTFDSSGSPVLGNHQTCTAAEQVEVGW